MKIRNGFVSNSSSSSFLIPINALTENQIINIKNHIEVTKKWLLQNDSFNNAIYADNEDIWNIQVNDKCVFGYTFMDNFNMSFFLKNILNLKNHIYWENFDGGFDLDLDIVNRELLQTERKDKLNSIEEKK